MISYNRWVEKYKMRIALIHALRHSIDPCGEAFRQNWPEADLRNIFDDSLSSDLFRDGGINDAMTARFLALTEYAVSSGAAGILFTCSAFGACIEACAAAWPGLPVLKPNEAVLEESANFKKIALMASFAPTLTSMPAEFGVGVEVVPCYIEGALDALETGNAKLHDQLTAAAAARLAGVDAIVLAQFSLARAAPAVGLATGLPVLTTPGCAVLKLRKLLT